MVHGDRPFFGMAIMGESPRSETRSTGTFYDDSSTKMRESWNDLAFIFGFAEDVCNDTSGWVEINEATEDSDTGNYYER